MLQLYMIEFFVNVGFIVTSVIVDIMNDDFVHHEIFHWLIFLFYCLCCL